MRSIFVRVEPTVRLGSEAGGVENTEAFQWNLYAGVACSVVGAMITDFNLEVEHGFDLGLL